MQLMTGLILFALAVSLLPVLIHIAFLLLPVIIIGSICVFIANLFKSPTNNVTTPERPNTLPKAQNNNNLRPTQQVCSKTVMPNALSNIIPVHAQQVSPEPITSNTLPKSKYNYLANNFICFSEIELRGLKYHCSSNVVESLTKGQSLQLIREPHNFYDPNAIKVTNLNNNNMLGYVAKEYAALISPYMDKGIMFDAVITGKEPPSSIFPVGRFFLSVRTLGGNNKESVNLNTGSGYSQISYEGRIYTWDGVSWWDDKWYGVPVSLSAKLSKSYQNIMAVNGETVLQHKSVPYNSIWSDSDWDFSEDLDSESYDELEEEKYELSREELAPEGLAPGDIDWDSIS